MTNKNATIYYTKPGYEGLASVLQRALTQASMGKGSQRHARGGEAFERQVICEGARRFGTGSLLFQAYKKAEESQRLDDERAVAELLGAINYLAAAVIVLEEQAAVREQSAGQCQQAPTPPWVPAAADPLPKIDPELKRAELERDDFRRQSPKIVDYWNKNLGGPALGGRNT